MTVIGTRPGEMILYYDGLCGLCDGFALFVAKRDKRQRIQLEPLQSEVARTLVPDCAVAADEPAGGTVVLDMGNEEYTRSEAVLRVLEALGGVWKLAAKLARLAPRSKRDAAYDFVARNRFRWFGRRTSCRIH